MFIVLNIKLRFIYDDIARNIILINLYYKDGMFPRMNEDLINRSDKTNSVLIPLVPEEIVRKFVKMNEIRRGWCRSNSYPGRC